MSTLAWIRKEKIKNEKGDPIEFIDRPFLLDIYTDRSQEIVFQKGAQVAGISTFAILDEIHDAKYLGINQIHTLPTVQDVQKFVPSKVNQIIRMNPCIFENINGDVDAVTQKQIGKAFLFFKGTFMEREAIMLSSDKNTYDEVDKSDMKVIRDYSSRMSASPLKMKRYISTPTIPDFGINRLWSRSDQKHWRFTCPYCKYRQHMEWNKNVDFDFKKYVCQRCHRELTKETIRSGSWEAKYPGKEMSGYWIPQMIATCRTAAELIKEFEDAEDDEYFYNFILGLPFLDPESKIPAGLILKNLTDKKNDEKNCIIGVDVGEKELHVIIGNEKGVFGITKLKDEPGKTKWERLGELLEVYEVRYCLIDALPETEKVLEFVKEYPYRAYRHFHKNKLADINAVQFADEGSFTDKSKDLEEEITVLGDINRIQDQTVSDLRKGKIKFNFKAGDSRIKELISHIQTMYVRTITDKVGQEHREWANTGANHYWDALCEWKIAFDRWKRDNQ